MLFKFILIEIIKHRVHHLEIMNVDVIKSELPVVFQ